MTDTELEASLSKTKQAKQPTQMDKQLPNNANSEHTVIEIENQLQDTPIGGSVNFESVHTYLDIMITLLIIGSGTFLYSMRNQYPWMPPFVILSYKLILLFFTLLKFRQITSAVHAKPSTLGAAWVWLLWLTYGVIFQNVHPLFNESMGYIQSAIAIGLVLTTYWKSLQKNTSYMHIITFTVLLLLFIPHVDTISHSMEQVLLFSKVALFYFLYAITEISIVLDREVLCRQGSTSKSTYQLKLGVIYNCEKTIIRSVWILMVSKYLMIGVVFQIIPILYSIWSSRTAIKRSYKKIQNDSEIYKTESQRDIEKPKISFTVKTKPVVGQVLNDPLTQHQIPQKQKQQQIFINQNSYKQANTGNARTRDNLRLEYTPSHTITNTTPLLRKSEPLLTKINCSSLGIQPEEVAKVDTDTFRKFYTSLRNKNGGRTHFLSEKCEDLDLRQSATSTSTEYEQIFGQHGGKKIIHSNQNSN